MQNRRKEYTNTNANAKTCYSSLGNYMSYQNEQTITVPIVAPVPVSVDPSIFIAFQPKLLSYYNPDLQLHTNMPGMGRVPNNKFTNYKTINQRLVDE
jgi:hypothetical protein